MTLPIVRAATLCAGFASLAFAGTTTPVTYYHDVVPILQKRCQNCHRPGEIGPMALLTYQQVRPWAKAIKSAVVSHVMPPWDADPRYGSFANDRSLPANEVDTLSKWVDAGAPEGKAADAPPPVEFADGWRIGKPDVVFEMPKEFHVPATGTVEYQWIKMPSGFTEDKWVEAVEVRPGNRAVVHHSVVYARDQDLQYGKKAPYGEFFQIAGEDVRGILKDRIAARRTMFSNSMEPEHLQVFAPGADPILLKPGQARLIRAGSDIIFEMHYTTNGKEATDRSKVGLVFAKQPPTERVRTIRLNNGTPLAIPPGEGNYQKESHVELLQPMKIVSFMPHMHLRGKSMEFRVTYPSGESEVLLSVPKYDFRWQMTYYLKEPKILPKGTVITCVAAFDNSVNNVSNPDPAKTVRDGRQSWDEMMAGFVDFSLSPTQSLDVMQDAAKTTAEVTK
jgi:hypothetical protein